VTVIGSIVDAMVVEFGVSIHVTFKKITLPVYTIYIYINRNYSICFFNCFFTKKRHKLTPIMTPLTDLRATDMEGTKCDFCGFLAFGSAVEHSRQRRAPTYMQINGNNATTPV